MFKICVMAPNYYQRFQKLIIIENTQKMDRLIFSVLRKIPIFAAYEKMVSLPFFPWLSFRNEYQKLNV